VAGETTGKTYVSRAPKSKDCASGVVKVSEGIALLGYWQLDAEEGATASAQFRGRRNRRLGGEIGDVGAEQGQEGILVVRWRSHDGGVRILE
jgi:hypothetical protein